MKVGYVLPTLQNPSGWRTFSIGAIRHLRAQVEPVLFVAEADLDSARRLFPDLQVIPLPAVQQASFSSVHSLRLMAATLPAVLLEKNTTLSGLALIHSLEAYPAGLFGHLLARRVGIPHLLTAVGTYAVVWREYPLDRLVYRQVLKGAALICPISTGTARLMQRYFGPAIDPARLKTILIGSNFTSRISRQTAEARVIPKTPRLISVGDIKPRKGQNVALEAFVIIKAAFPEARYDIVGHYKPNPYFEGMQAFVKSHGLKDVYFHGTVSEEDLQRYYRDASLFILTPQEVGLHFEGFGLVYLEAGAYGLPVVGTRTGGVPDAVREGDTGFLAEPDDPQGIAAAIIRLLQDEDLNRRMGLANRDWAETLTWERYAGEQVRAYRTVAEGRAA